MGIKATGFTRYYQKYQRALRLSDTLLGIVEARSSLKLQNENLWGGNFRRPCCNRYNYDFCYNWRDQSTGQRVIKWIKLL